MRARPEGCNKRLGLMASPSLNGIAFALRRRDKKTRSAIKHAGFRVFVTPQDAGQNLLLVPIVGFELTTYRLQGGCSTN